MTNKTEKSPLVEVASKEKGTSTSTSTEGCPWATASTMDPAAVPLPVAIALPIILLVWGSIKLSYITPLMTDGQEQIFHGVLMSLIAYPLGLAIPHAKIKKVMSLAHGASLLQGSILVAYGLAWHTAFGFVDKSSASTWAKYINLYGMWGNTIGILWGAITGAKDLFYWTKDSVSYQAPNWQEVTLHILLKSQGLCNIIAMIMILKQMSASIGGYTS